MKKESKLLKKYNRTGFLLCLPTILALLLSVYTLAYALLTSLNTNSGYLKGEFKFAGLDNYIKVLNNSKAIGAMGNTILYVVCTIIIEIALALLVSAALRKQVTGTSIFKLLIIVPMMMAPVATGAIWKWMYSDRYGIINYCLDKIGLEGPSWLGMPIPAKFAILIVSIWSALPFSILILTAAIGAVSDGVIEAAKIDGATDLQVYWNIIFPHLKPSVLLILMIRIPDALRMYDLVYILTKGGPANSTQVVSYYIYQKGFGEMKFPEASAASFILFIFIIGVTCFMNFIVKERRKNNEA